MLDKMRMSTACFARAPQRLTSRLSKHLLLTFQEVTPLSKTRNQLYISMNWRGKPLTSHEVIVNLIAKTTTQTGLKIRTELDSRPYPTGIKVRPQELENVRLSTADFHGEWNYSILPTSST